MEAASTLPAITPNTNIVTTAEVGHVLERYFDRDEFRVTRRATHAATTTGALGVLGIGLIPIAPISFLYGIKRTLCDRRPVHGLSIMTVAVTWPLSSPALIGISACLWGVTAASLICGTRAATANDGERATVATAALDGAAIGTP